VEAAWVNLPHLLFGFIKPFKIAQAYENHAPNGKKFGLGHRRGTSGKRGKGNYKAILEGLLESTNEVEPLGWARFAPLADLALKIDWYFFLADLTTDFLVNWVSLAYQWSGCREPGDGWAQGHAEIGIPVGTNAGTFIYDEWIVDNQDILFMDSASIAGPVGYDFSCGYTITTGIAPIAPDIPVCSWSSRLIDQTNDIVYDTVGASPTTGGQGASYMFKASQHDLRSHKYVVEVTKSEGMFWVTGGNFTGGGGKGTSRGLLPDP
jgi:hypothetical protein